MARGAKDSAPCAAVLIASGQQLAHHLLKRERPYPRKRVSGPSSVSSIVRENARWRMEGVQTMDLGSLAGTIGAEWIGKPPHEELDRKVRPLLPSEDPFYQPPPGYQHALPGTVLRSRDVEVAFFGLIRLRATATQLLYRTMDMNGKPEAAVTTVIVPAGVAPGQTCPLLSYQCAIDAVTSRCFPSYALRRHAKAIGAVPQFDFLLDSAALARAWRSRYPTTKAPTGCGAHRTNLATASSTESGPH